MTTYCADCDGLQLENKSDPPWRWLCRHHKRGEGYGFVTKTTWDSAPPYLFCRDVNGGFCPLYTPKPEPKETEHGKNE